MKTNSRKQHAGEFLFGEAGAVQIPLFVNRVCAADSPHHFELLPASHRPLGCWPPGQLSAGRQLFRGFPLNRVKRII